MYQSCSLGAPDGAVSMRAPLGGIRNRVFDIAGSMRSSILAPILLAIAALVRSLMRKSVVVTDECVGFGGKPFVRYQFSSAEDEKANKSSTLLRPWPENLEGAVRASGLKELPLLFNVLRGDMSLTGPQHPARRRVKGIL